MAAANKGGTGCMTLYSIVVTRTMDGWTYRNTTNSFVKRPSYARLYVLRILASNVKTVSSCVSLVNKA